MIGYDPIRKLPSVTVQELARDDKSAAVSGISQGDFIITTSNKPVEAGKQVRLADNG